jgi:hypothetical protein
MKTNILVLGLISLFMLAAPIAQASFCDDGIDRLTGPEVPFPLNTDLPFPWGTIEGVWEAKTNNVDAMFSFEVQTDANNRKILRVLHVDPVSHKILAEGTGISIDERRIVRAAMSGGDAGNYMLFIGAYKKAQGGTFNVLTIRSFVSSGNRDVQVIVRKILQSPLTK